MAGNSERPRALWVVCSDHPPSWSRSNVLGTKFTIFDNGVNPERKNFVPETTRIREELGAVCYVSFLETREDEAGRWGGERARPTGA